ncbi:uncharacterized protein N7473_003959 [Penicillium subrubescens]|uniref:Uncharacterized protein n=1 Tax=Penicillium subrubescens TaxID=1316194 RepID=A0A1Q5U9V5_9EURO|nr:uncharacterized protein N7473_003959 [Penicillium subrubescens]KAJ5907043.1 hypothetical protein N7473_003959 [Penicillium subrubescens]OKP09255.1 hypothetical protein PENSUB_5341 [Penicillium subrubescens]
MKGGLRFALCASLLLFFSLYLLEAHLKDICSQYRAGAYLIDWLDRNGASQRPTVGNVPVPGDKVIVMAKLQEEPTEWVQEELPDWQRAIYIVNPSEEARSNPQILTTPLNKGHESMAYLTYVIDHYDTLPSTIAFLHAHRAGFLMAWHNDAPLHDNVNAMRMLQTNFVQENGYANLRCNWNPGCKDSHRFNIHVTEQVWWDVFEGTSTPPLNASSPYEQEFSGHKYMRKPEQIGAACCAQFAVSRSQVLQRPREDYVKFRQWIIDTELNDAMSGRVMEFLWHVIFGMDAVYCPDEELCYCQVYGKC